MKKSIRTLLILCLAACHSQAFSFASPVSIAIIPPLQFPTSEFSVTGVRASVLYGRHRDVYGFDVGLLGNITEQEFVGIGLAGGFNLTKGNTTALVQAAGVANINTNKTDIIGLQAAALMNMNDAASSVTGLQLAAVNIAPHTVIRGFQVGVYNRALKVYGIQVGLVNRVDNLYGLQIGLANFHHKGTFVVSPILNFGF